MNIYTDWEIFLPDLFEAGSVEHAGSFARSFKYIQKEDIDDFCNITFCAQQDRDDWDDWFEYSAGRRWRKFLLSVYYADKVSYSRKEDQVDFSRLWYILNKFPRGFTVWWLRLRAGLRAAWYPAGYTGWYYIEEAAFNEAARREGRGGVAVQSRFFLPAAAPTPYLYLFNYSIAPALKHTEYSRALIKEYAASVGALDYAGLCCAVVSEDGARVAERFGMKKTGPASKAGAIYAMWKE